MNTTNSKYLSDLQSGEEALIVRVMGRGAFRKRITEMGFVKGKQVKVIKSAPLLDPVEYEIMGYKISLRRSEAELVEVVSLESEFTLSDLYNGTIDEHTLKVSDIQKGKLIRVALVGNPNCGKTTLFNYVSGSHERVGNYSGVTVDSKEGFFKHKGFKLNLTDLPGTYSITEYTPEELYVRSFLMEKMPDVVINVVDASNLERNLFLTTQLIDMNIKVVIALNMYDEFESTGAKFRYKTLGEMIGIPIIPTVASKGKGLKELFNKVVDVYEEKDPTVRHIHINYGETIENCIRNLQDLIWKNPYITNKVSSRFLAIKLLEGDKSIRKSLKVYPNYDEIKSTSKKHRAYLEKAYDEDPETVLTDAKYGFIDGALRETLVRKSHKQSKRKLKEIDDVLTHRFWGYPLFLFFMWVMFQSTFTLGSYPMDWIDKGFHYLGEWMSSVLPKGPLEDLLVDGIIGGVGGVMIFLPNILILFFFISLMEDSGYMARASFIMDKLMNKIGLHGKSFIPLLMGFGCNVPAIMATRTLDNRKDRILTMLITPFMSCSARLPVYVLLISAIFPAHQGLVLFSIYLIGVLLAILTALLLKKTLFKKSMVPFVMELPPYRIPTFRNTLNHMWYKAREYLKKMGSVILIASVLIWALGYFPKNEHITDPTEKQEKSYIGQMGHAIEPVIEPLGFDWKMGVSILSGLAAKEIVVSTMGILYHADEEVSENTLKQKLKEQEIISGSRAGEKVFTPLVSFGFMVFVLIYFPCVAVIAAIRKESNWRWAVFAMFYTTGIAWLISMLIYQIGSRL